jgi:hypothetical protein
MEKKKNDVLNGDHSFKMWFKIMWGNTYIQLFVLALAFFIGILTQYNSFDGWGFWVCLTIPSLTMIVIAYKGFYQFWNDLKNGETR